MIHRLESQLARCRTIVLPGLVLSCLQLVTVARISAQEALGTVDFRVSCSGQVQAEFNRAVALLHHMTYPRAREAFEAVIRLDPQCAMGHWGVAMTLFQPLWPTRPGPQELQRGWDAAQTALRRRCGGRFLSKP
jgi:hypothetical protein